MRAREFEDLIANLSPPLAGEEGVRFGDPQVEVRGVLVTWMPTCAAISAAAERACNLVICHEDLFFPYSGARAALEVSLNWPVSRNRIGLLVRHGLTVLRAHGSLDRLCVVDEFARAVGLRGEVMADGLARVFTISEVSLGDLARQVKRSLRLARIRVVGDLERRITKVGVAVGGIGLSVNISFWERLLSAGAQVVLTGETDEYAMRYAEDSGIGVIETTHAVSENPGLRRFCDILRERFPDVPVEFHECGVTWQDA